MAQIIELDTPRLRLRRWRESDRAPFAALNADPAVMEFLPALQSREARDSCVGSAGRGSGPTGPAPPRERLG